MTIHDEWLADVKPTRNVGGRPRERSDSDQRNRKLECVSCGFICRASAAAIRGAGAPSCGCGAGPLSVPLARDAAVIDPSGDVAQTMERVELAQHERTEARRAKSHARSAGGPHICQASGCHKFARGRYCPEHVDERPAMGSAYKGRAA